MIAADLRPTDPVRWYYAYAIEVDRAEREHDSAAATAGRGSDIEVLDS